MKPDVGCGAFLGAARRTTCQLYVGHDGNHVALVLTDRGRVMRSWSTQLAVTDVEFSAQVAAGLPWAPGQPSATSAVQLNLTLVADTLDVANFEAGSDVPVGAMPPSQLPAGQKRRRLHVAS